MFTLETTINLIGMVVWLLPLIIYLLVFADPPKMRLLWGILTFLFSWLGLIGRVIYGLIK